MSCQLWMESDDALEEFCSSAKCVDLARGMGWAEAAALRHANKSMKTSRRLQAIADRIAARGRERFGEFWDCPF